MKYEKKQKTIHLTGNTFFEGKSIEKEMDIAVNTKQMPERNMSSVFYTQRRNGVLPECDIRTDKWDMAQTAQNKIAVDFRTYKKQQELEQSQITDETSINEAER